MLPQAAVAVLTSRLQTGLLIVANRVGDAMQDAWVDLPAYDEVDIAQFEAVVAPVVTAAKGAATALGSSYFAGLANLAPPSVDPVVLGTVFDARRPFIAHWQALKAGRPWEEALDAGALGADAAASDFVVSTSRQTGDVVYAKTETNVRGWRRVLEVKACEWCQLVSTQRYRTSASADFGHDHCHCSPVPIIGTDDPGRVINSELLRTLKDQGVVDKITRQQQLPRAQQALQNAERRVTQLRAEVASETDQERETRLEKRLDKWVTETKRRQARIDAFAAARSR